MTMRVGSLLSGAGGAGVVAGLKPYYERAGVTIYHGDCLTFLGKSGVVADAVITDPPYGAATYPTDTRLTNVTLLMLKAAAPTVAVFGYPELLVRWCIEAFGTPDEWVTWWPTNKAAGRSKERLPKEQEAIAIFGPTPGAAVLFRSRSENVTCLGIAASRGLDQTLARQGDVWRDASPGMAFNYHLRRHPNEKPLSLMIKLVLLCSSPGDVILDPFCGSGTTLLAAKSLGRRAIGIEIDEQYAEMAASRLAQDVLPLELPAELPA